MHRSVLRKTAQMLRLAAASLVLPGSLASGTDMPELTLESHPLAGRVFDLDGLVEIGPRGLLDRAIATRFVLLGETHDNPRHHQLQARVLDAIAASGRRPVVAWEMIDASRGEVLADCVARCRDWVHELPECLEWDASGWPAWQMYEPVAAVAARYGLELAAANLSPDERRLLGGPTSAASGALSERLGIESTLPPAAMTSLAAAIEDSHCGMSIPTPQLESMVRVQRGRDRRMRDVLVERSGVGGAVLIAGSGHARLDWGAGHDLLSEAGAAEVLSVAFIEVDRDCRTLQDCLEDRSSDATAWNVVWFTARAEREDPCERLRRSGHLRSAGPDR